MKWAKQETYINYGLCRPIFFYLQDRGRGVWSCACPLLCLCLGLLFTQFYFTSRDLFTGWLWLMIKSVFYYPTTFHAREAPFEPSKLTLPNYKLRPIQVLVVANLGREGGAKDAPKCLQFWGEIGRLTPP